MYFAYISLINSGSSNVKYEEISSKTVTAEFGTNSLYKTEIASIIGVAAIIVFMICFYRFSGLISSLSILIYTSLVFLVFYLIDGVLTLTGIGALVLGIGMDIPEYWLKRFQKGNNENPTPKQPTVKEKPDSKPIVKTTPTIKSPPCVLIKAVIVLAIVSVLKEVLNSNLSLSFCWSKLSIIKLFSIVFFFIG